MDNTDNFTRLPKIVEVLKDALLRRLGDEVELIFQYGSFLKGNTHPYSDIDLSYTPQHESTWECITIMLDETMVDLYPMHWSKLEQMASFEDLSSSVLLQNRIVYQRDEAAAERFRALSARLLALQEPEAQPEMLRKAQKIFQSAAYPAYLLRLEAEAGNYLGCLQHSQDILHTVLHCLAVCNQSCIDTRKLARVMDLPKLPDDFANQVEAIMRSGDTQDQLDACQALLDSTRRFLLVEQRRILCRETSFPDAFGTDYVELKAAMQRIMLGCEEGDLLRIKTSLASLYQELSRAMAEALTGFACTGFNTPSDYEQDFARLGFPALLPYLLSGDLPALRQQVIAFDQHLQKFLSARSVGLFNFASLEELEKHLSQD